MRTTFLWRNTVESFAWYLWTRRVSLLENGVLHIVAVHIAISMNMPNKHIINTVQILGNIQYKYILRKIDTN